MRLRLLALAALVTASWIASAAELPDYPRLRIDTSEGSFVVELDRNRAPLTVENFVRYAQDGFYEGLVFHRVINNFVAQGGGYDGEHQLRQPTYEPVPNESGNGLSNLRGTLGMARTSKPHSATSQFYINLQDNPDLDPLNTRWGYAVFGKVVEGMDVVEKIGLVATGASLKNPEELGSDVPQEDIVIRAVVLLNADGASR